MKKLFLSAFVIAAAVAGVNAQHSDQRWMKIQSGSEIPANAVIGGRDSDGSPLFVAHANWNGNWQPGKTRKDWNTTSIEYGDQEVNAPDYEILLGNEGLSWVRVNQGNVPENAVVTGHENQNNLCSCRAEFQGTLQVGKTWQGIDGCRIGYGGGGKVLHDYEVLVYTPRSGGMLRGAGEQWVKIQSGNDIPADAVIGGRDGDGSPLFVAHANWNGNWHPGKTRRDWNTTSIEYGNQEVNAPDYEILLGNEGLTWVRVNQGSVPDNAIVAGHENQNDLLSCRGEFQGTLQVGKTWRGIDGCRIGYGGGGQVLPNYEVLVSAGPGRRTGRENFGNLTGAWMLTTSSTNGCDNAQFNYAEASCKDNGVSCTTLTFTEGNGWSDSKGGRGTYAINGNIIRFSSAVDGSYSEFEFRLEGGMLTEKQKNNVNNCVLTVHYRRAN
jgi:hypothetical protein